MNVNELKKHDKNDKIVNMTPRSEREKNVGSNAGTTRWLSVKMGSLCTTMPNSDMSWHERNESMIIKVFLAVRASKRRLPFSRFLLALPWLTMHTSPSNLICCWSPFAGAIATTISAVCWRWWCFFATCTTQPSSPNILITESADDPTDNDVLRFSKMMNKFLIKLISLNLDFTDLK